MHIPQKSGTSTTVVQHTDYICINLITFLDVSLYLNGEDLLDRSFLQLPVGRSQENKTNKINKHFL